MQTYRYIIARKRYTIITITHTSYSSAACLYWITDGRIHQSTFNEVAAEWYIHICTTLRRILLLNTLLLLLSAFQVLHASIPRYRTPRRHLYSIHDTPHGNVLKHRLVDATYTIMRNILVYLHNTFQFKVNTIESIQMNIN